MTFRDFFWPVRRKESLARTVTTMNQIGKPVATPEKYENYAKIGYGQSVIVYRCVSMIASAAKGMTFDLYDKSNAKKPKEILEHPLLALWYKPNPLQSTADLVENLIAFYCLDGNSYLESNTGIIEGGKVPLELWNVRPDKMTVVGGPKGYPQAYQFSNGTTTRVWPVDLVKMHSDILHWKTFHPLDDWYGMSPMKAVLLSLDQNLAGQKWNLALLQNAATPSGILQMQVSEANPRGELTDAQYAKLREQIDEKYTGVRNAGKPMLLEGGLKWTSTMLSPKDVDYSKGKEITATDIALAFGIPPELLGLGQKTFNNYREARLSFYEETVLPIMDSAMGAVNRWLGPAFGENLCLEYDKDDIEILQWKREQKYTSLQSVNFLNQNEKREAVGYEPVEGWDVFVIGNQMGELPEDFSGGSALDDTGNQDPANDPSNEDEDPKKPGEDDTGSGDNDDSGDGKKPKPDDDESDGGEESADDSKGWKAINLVNQNEKKASWRKQNHRRKKLTAAFNRDLVGDFKELISHLKKVTGHSNDSKLTEFALVRVMSDFMPTMEKTLKRHIRYSLEDFGGMILGEGKSMGYDRESKANLKFDHYVNHYTETRSGAAIKSITSTSTKVIRRVVGEWVQTAIADGDSNADLSKFIESEFEELTPGMATRIARTEVSLASNNGALEAVKSLQIPNMFKEWVTANDDRVRDGDHGGADHGVMNGAEVELDEKFGVPPDSLMDGPGDTSAPADQVINCRCVLTYRNKG
jgi:HK97 family phage portal protein